MFTAFPEVIRAALAEPEPMLPGIRFLLAAILLSMSILIFGLGAAALLRAAHEEVASVPTRRVMPEPVYAQPAEAPAPTLAMLRIEPAVPEKAPDPPPAATPAPEAVPVPKVEAEKLTAPRLDDVAAAETATPEIAAQPEIAAKPEAAALETPPSPTVEPAAARGTQVAALDAAPSPPVETAPVPFEQIVAPAMIDPGVAVTKTAALGSPAAKIEKPAEAKKAGEKPDRAEIRKQQRAERARERRRQAARRARLAAQQAAAQQAADPFSQTAVPSAQQATTTTRRRQ